MQSYHQHTRGWLAKKLGRKQWLVLGLFLVFYLGLLYGGEQFLPHNVRVNSAAVTCDPATSVSQNTDQPKTQDYFMGLP